MGFAALRCSEDRPYSSATFRLAMLSYCTYPYLFSHTKVTAKANSVVTESI